MEDSNISLGESVSHVRLDDKNIYLVGTAHVSKESVEDVKATIEAVNPDTICVELCPARHKAMTQPDSWEKMDIFKIIKEKKSVLLLAQLIMSSFYRRLGEQLGVQPGAEMLEGVRQAEERGAELVLADRDIQITLKRVWGYLGFWNKMKLLTHILLSVFSAEKIDEELIEEIKKQDQLENVMSAFTKSFPEIKKRLIDERDIYLSQKTRNAGGKNIVVVVGAGHVPGITEHIQKDYPLEPLIEIPPKSIVPSIFKWAIPLLIIGILIAGFFRGSTEHFLQSIYIWVFVNGVLSALGAATAFGHPVTILASFIAAPLTSLNPAVAAGWVAGLVQACVKKPTVADFQNLPNAVSTVKGFWSNPVTRILLVVVLANLGSALGTYISLWWIGTRTF